MTDREKMDTVKKNTQKNCVPAAHTREVQWMPIPRPPSPNAKTQTRLAAESRKKRSQYFEETGIELGPGDDLGDEPKILTPPKKGVRWESPLEAGFEDELEMHSPTAARTYVVDKGLVKKDQAVSTPIPT
jgi:hypothetical protein